MTMSLSLRALSVAGVLLAAASANAADIVGSTAVGSLIFEGNGTNYFSPGGGYVPSDYSNHAGNAVVLGDPAKDFGFNDGSNLDAADFTNKQLYVSDTVLVSGSNVPWTMTFTDPSFKSISLVTSSFAPGLTYGIVGDTIVLSWAATTVNAGLRVAVFNLNSVAAVPEPGTYALMATGLLAMGFMARRRNGR